DLERTVDLFQGDGGDRAAEDGRIVPADDALDTGDHADAGHESASDTEVGTPAGERAQLEEGRIAIEQQLDALADQELASLPLAGPAPLPPAAPGDRHLRL